MKAKLAPLFSLLALLGCSEQEVVAELRSLQASEDVLFVCRDAGGEGHPLEECPDRDSSDDTEQDKNLSMMALVSQTLTDEVALVDISSGKVIDTDPSTPGFGFLRVGGRPVSMATTPGGRASFVATAEVGRNGIFALPTSCLGPPSPDQTQRDLTTWAACRLNAAPGEISVVVDGSGDPSAESCTGAELPQLEPHPECPADLSTEGGAAGRRKLVVSLPDSGQLAVLDAQRLLDTPPGTFPDCEVEYLVQLSADVPSGVTQTLPADLQTSCSDAPAPTPPTPSRSRPRPAGFALADNRLYIADEAAPVVHVLDTSDACAIEELSPLLPMSLREPWRVVTTRKVAASPLSPSGKRYVYAIDAEDQPGASVMAFDVSPGSSDPTPIVRSGSPELPREKPDRLAIDASARDITFAYRDLPYVDESSGVAEFGAFCDPSPLVSSEEPGGRARPNGDYSVGARPGLLRGLFGFVLLTNGSIAVVDVEDLDAPCRRPVQGNQSEGEDFRGCVGPEPFASYVLDGARTVTDEVSCRIVEPHRFRSARLSVNDSSFGVRAPALRGFPQLSVPPEVSGGAVEDRPRLLGVPYDGGRAAEVFIGSASYSTDESAGEPLPTNPNSRASEQLEAFNAVVLPPLQPRAYAAEDSVALTYEGSYAGDRPAGFLDSDGSFGDRTWSFCAAGAYDVAAMADYAQTELGLAGAEAQAFGEQHADYVQLTTGFPAEDDSYWAKSGVERGVCVEVFGPEDAESLSPNRDFSVRAAFGDRLVLERRGPDERATVDLASRCFPAASSYRLRASRHWVLTRGSTGFQHDIVESGSERACVRSCDPLRKWAKGRAFEISSVRESCKAPAEGQVQGNADIDALQQRVGCAEEGEVACVFDQGPAGAEVGGVQPGQRGSECIFDGLTERFAVYRGRQPSVRDAAFRWQTTGGFVPLVMSLTGISTSVSPQSIQFLRQPEVLAVVDGSSLGLSLFSLDTFEVAQPSPFY